MDFIFKQGSDPGEELSKKTLEIFKNPGRYGKDKLTFSEAFSIAQRENPELTQAYSDYLFGDGKSRSYESDAGEELSKKTVEIFKNPGRYGKDELTFSEAFTIAQKENPELAQAYSDYLFKNY